MPDSCGNRGVAGVTMGEADSHRSIVVLLYGSYEYDGRVQRMISVLGDLGPVTLVAVGERGAGENNGPLGVRRVRVHLPRQAGKIRKHILFWRVALRTARCERPSVVVAENFFTTFPAWISARLTRAKLVYDAYELIIPDSTQPMSCRDRFWYFLERWTVRRADLVFAANEDRARLMADHYHLETTPAVMRNIPPPVRVCLTPVEVARLFPWLNRRASNDVIVLYQGDISLSRGIDRFIRALAYLEDEYRIAVVGGGPDLDQLRAMGQAFEDEGRLWFSGRVEHRLLPSITRMADVGIVTYPFKGQNNIWCAPNKLFEYAQAGIPVVATDQPPLRRLVESYGIGALVSEKDSPQQIAAHIQEVAQNRVEYARGLRNLLEDHRWEDEAKRVRTAFEELLNRRG